MTKTFRLATVLSAILLVSIRAQSPSLPQDLRDRIDAAARQVLAATGVPSASIAVVRDGKLAYAQTYGDASLAPRVAARPDMRYAVGSISKQFTAAAVLLLAEQGKLSLDDKISRFLPALTRASDVTIRQVLSHTSGYQDYWPQDYVPPFMTRPTTAQQILDQWARKPLDFEPGTQWQYSNTGYVVAGLIVEKAGGTPLVPFLRDRVFRPLGMASVADVDQGRLTEPDPVGYMRYALGPLRPAPKEGAGWLFAAGELAMTAGDLAKWDISVIDQALLKPASYQVMASEVLLKNGQSSRYGLGLNIRSDGGRRALEHGGEVSGFTAENVIYPDDRASITVLTNEDAVGAAGDIARRIAPLLFAAQDAEAAQHLQKIRAIFEDLQRGKLDRSLFTPNCNAYFTDQAIADMAASLGPLGAPQSFTQTSKSERGGMTFRGYQVRTGQKTIVVTVRTMPDGKIEQYQIAPG